MPDLTIHEGGGGDRETNLSQVALETLVVELLRSLARAEPSARTLTEAFVAFVDHASDASIPLGQLVDTTIRNMHNRALAPSNEEDFHEGIRRILVCALRVTAESLANDNAARGRFSQRLQSLEIAIEDYVIGRERRARENGWSYISKLRS